VTVVVVAVVAVAVVAGWQLWQLQLWQDGSLAERQYRQCGRVTVSTVAVWRSTAAWQLHIAQRVRDSIFV
jgi:predicted negative regulator of RcsB-dependent stress response